MSWPLVGELEKKPYLKLKVKTLELLFFRETVALPVTEGHKITFQLLMWFSRVIPGHWLKPYADVRARLFLSNKR